MDQAVSEGGEHPITDGGQAETGAHLGGLVSKEFLCSKGTSDWSLAGWVPSAETWMGVGWRGPPSTLSSFSVWPG